MELRHLRYFTAVAEAMSFRKAADILNISQPPLSLQIRDLERELGAMLFIREKRRIRLTEAGTLFLVRAKAILADADSAKKEAHLAQSGKTGTLRIHFISSAVTGILQTLVKDFKKAYPLVEVKLSQSVVQSILNDVKNESIDIGFVRVPVALPETLTSRLVLRESYYVALQAAHPLLTKKSVSPKDLKDEKLIIYPRDTASGSFDDVISLFRQHGVVPDIVQEAPEQLTIAGLVASGMGYSVVPECMTRIKIPGVAHLPLAGGRNKTGIAVVAAKNHSAAVRNFLDMIAPA